MSSKSLGGLLVLVALLGVGWYYTREDEYTQRSAPPSAFDAFGDLKLADVQRVSVSKGTSTVNLKRSGGEWLVEQAWNYAAPSAAIERLVDSVSNISQPEIRAENEASLAGFELDDDNGYRLELSGSGDALPLRIVVGKSSFGGQRMPTRCFIRFADEVTVYEVKPCLPFDAGLLGKEDPESWVDKKVFALEELEIAKIVMEFEDETIEIAAIPNEGDDAESEDEEETQYAVVAPSKFTPDETTMKSLLGQFRYVYARKLVDPSRVEDYGLEAPDRRVRVEFTEGDPLTLEFGGVVESDEAATKTYYVRRTGDSRIFTLADTARNGMFKSIEELTPPPIGDEPEAIQPDLPVESDG